MIALIAALDENNVIGNKGKLPWDLPEDLQLFRKTTSDSVVIMGKTTYESIGRPLPKRINIVVSTSLTEAPQGTILAHSPEDALHKAKECGKTIFIIGGAGIYKAFLTSADRLYLSHVKGTHEGDTYFPKVDYSQWKVIEEHSFPDFVQRVYERK
ncbi:MAG: dihydrofolate reductase [Candidatus Woesearchaeota archaeon]